jgi:hypothetical protein
MNRTTTGLLTFASALALATAAGAQGKGGGPAGGAHGGPTAAPPVTSTLPSAATTARQNSQGAAHAADIAKEKASPNSAIAPTAPTTATATTGTDAAATTDATEEARAKRQGPANASPTGVANANEHAGLASATTTTDLTNLKTGLTVKDAAGTTLGTVSKIMKSSAGMVENVLVTGADGKTYRVAPDNLSLSGDVVIAASKK